MKRKFIWILADIAWWVPSKRVHRWVCKVKIERAATEQSIKMQERIKESNK